MYTREWTVRFGDVDMFQIGFYPRIIAVLRDTSDMFMESIDFPFWKLIEERELGFPIVEAGIEFERPVEVGEIVSISLIPILGRTSVRFEFEATCDGEASFTAFEQRVCLPVGGTETIPIPNDLRTALEEQM